MSTGAPAGRRPAPSGARARHVCSACGADSPKWQGRCPGCGAWNTLEEGAAVAGVRLVGGRMRPPPSAAGVPGSVSQVREAVARLLLCAKSSGVPVLVVGHVTKEGAIAGPRTLEHMVDVVLYLEGERHGDHRLLRGIKNRFGATGELGIFVMAEGGMEEADAPGRAFLDEGSLGVAGNALTVTCEGSRPLAGEAQALPAPTPFGLPRRTASGFDLGRLHLLLAVLEKRAC